MRIAYVIAAHKLPEQLIRLVNRLNGPGASFFIHVDKKVSADVFGEMTRGLDGMSNVVFIKRHKCFWGEPSILNTSLEGIRALFASGIEFDRLILLSGQDYPLASNDRIQSFFKTRPDKQFIDWHDYRVEGPPDAGWPESGIARVTNWHFRVWKINLVVPGRLESNSINRYCRARFAWMKVVSAIWSALMLLVPVKRKFPAGLQPYYFGSQFCCLSREFAGYINDLIVTRHPFYRFFQYVDIADEMFYQNVVMSSRFKESVVNDNLFCIDWKNPNPQVPRTFVSEDFGRLVESERLFARKFDMTRDAGILDALDRHAQDPITIAVRETVVA